MKLYRNRTSAEDAVSDTITRALSNRTQFREGTNLHGWLLTILRNAFYSQQKKAWRLTYTDNTNYAANLKTAGDPESAMIARESIQALDSVRPKQREAVEALLFCDGYNDAARTLGIPTGTVKSRAKRGRDTLAKLIST